MYNVIYKMNSYILSKLNEEATELFKTGDKFKAVTITKAIKILNEEFSDEKIVTAIKDKVNGRKIPGIGAGIVGRIAIILESGEENEIEVPVLKKEDLYKMRAEAVMLAKSVRDVPKFSPIGWWMSEKWDGYRAIWTGARFLSRNGNEFTVPKSFSDIMPRDTALDGELWVGYGKFEEAGLFRKGYVDLKEWSKYNVRYKVFDIPSMNAPFEERMSRLREIVEKQCKNVPSCPIEYTEQIQIKSEKQLEDYYNEALSHKGEGLILRKPKSAYEPKRTSAMLKKKPQWDSECAIIGYRMGKGRNTGRLGSFECEWYSPKVHKNVKFNLSGMTDEVRNTYKSTHPIGTTLTFQYMGLSGTGRPRHPVYIRKRTGWRRMKIFDLPPLSSSVWNSFETAFKYIEETYNVPIAKRQTQTDICNMLRNVRIYE